MAETEQNYAGLAMSPEIFEILQTGAELHDLEVSAGYRRLMEFLRGRAAAALKAMRDAPYAEDRVRLSMQFQWQLCEDVVRDVETHIKDAISLAKAVARDVDISALAREGFAMQFSSNGEDEEE